MNIIHNIIEPNRILLVWKSRTAAIRRNLVVGEVIKDENGVCLNYLHETTDYIQAINEGFKGYQTFPFSRVTHSNGVVDAFMKRLPPKGRPDFEVYIRQFHILPEIAKGMSDLALLAYLEAKLPGDGFSFIHPFDECDGPCQLLIEVAGYRHHGFRDKNIQIGTHVTFRKEPENRFDSNAVKIQVSDATIGYVSHPQLPTFNRWLDNSQTTGVLTRLNGTEDEPRAFIFVNVKPD